MSPCCSRTFSILERIDVGETRLRLVKSHPYLAFSILERIDVGETVRVPQRHAHDVLPFQYPRTDRRG